MKIRIKEKKAEFGVVAMKPYEVLKIGNFGFWFINEFNEKDYYEFKSCEQQLESGRWENISV